MAKNKKAKKYWDEFGELKISSTVFKALTCKNCGTPVPLQSGKLQKCFACGTENELSDEFVNLQQSQAQFNKSAQKSESMLKRISSPPSVFLRVWTAVSNFLFTVLGMFYTALTVITGLAGMVALAMLYILIYKLAPALGENYIDTIGAGRVYFICTLVLSVVIVLPMVLSGYFKDIVQLKSILQGSLSLKFPETGKGYGNCRGCGAPLQLKSGDIYIRCPYCETENLSAVPEKWLEKVKNFTNWHFKTIDEAINKEQKFKKESRSNIVWWAIITLVFAFIFALIGFVFSWSDMEYTPTVKWKVLNKEPRMLIAANEISDNESFDVIEPGKITEGKIFAEYYWIALKKNEKLRISINNPALLLPTYLRNSTDNEGTKIYHLITWATGGQLGFIYEFTAPYTGKFCIMPQLLHGNLENESLQLLVTIE